MPSGICVVCRNEKQVFKSRQTGALICSSCKKRKSLEECVRCGEQKRVVDRDDDGCAICFVCNQFGKIQICVGCGKRKSIHAKQKCDACYIKEYKKSHRHAVKKKSKQLELF